jgi:uncharacterized metal-binding protein YceD (DUF177 family)
MQKDFSYPLQIDELNQGEQSYMLRADKAQLETLKEILQVPAVNYFEADIKLKFQKKRGILDVSGQVRAGLGLISVISLEPFDRDYKTDFTLTFDTNATYEQIRELDEDIEADIPDIVIGGRIDLGDIAIEQLALVMEDHPRQDGEEFSPLIEDDAPLRENPFAILSKLKK